MLHTTAPTRRSIYQRYGGWLLLVTGCVAVLAVYAASRTIQSNSNKVADWLPASYVETAELNWFREHFPEDQFIVVSWDDCFLGDDPALPTSRPDDPRIERLARWLEGLNTTWREAPAAAADGLAQAESEAVPATTGPPVRINSVMTGRRFLERFTRPPLSLPYATAKERLQGIVIGPDGRTTCLLVALDNDSSPQFRALLGRPGGGLLRFRREEGVLWRGLRECGIDRDSVRLGGPPVDNVAIDEEGESTMVRLAVLACLFGLLLSWWALRSLWLTWIVFTCGILSAALGLAAVWLTGETADAVVLSMPSLIYVLAISNAVHLVNYYRDAIEEVGPQDAPRRAIAHGWKPTLLCSVTTAIGLMSLYTSDLAPIRKFGCYSALAMMLMLAVLFVYLPAALQFLPSADGERLRGADAGPPGPADAGNGYLWFGMHSWILRHHVWVSLLCLSLTAVVGMGVTRVRTSVDLMKFFRGEARILEDYRWLESRIGRLVPMEVVVRFSGVPAATDEPGNDGPRGCRLLDREELVARVETALQQQFGEQGQDVIGPSLSAARFLPPLPKRQRGASTVMRRTIANARLEQCYDALTGSGYLQVDPGTGDELWRISLRVAAFRGVDYGRFADEVRQLVEPLLVIDQDDEGGAVVSAVYTGVVPIVYKAQRALLESLISSAVWSFVTILPLLMFIARGVRAGIVAMLPNVLPILVVFGGMGWLGLSVDIGAMMSASIALGVAVDDTIHYLTWFREDLRQSGSRHAAILTAYRRTAAPTLQAALINGLGLSVFAWSTFNPTKQLGYLMLTILLAGVVAELVLLPALLASPLGRAFQTRASAAWWHVW